MSVALTTLIHKLSPQNFQLPTADQKSQSASSLPRSQRYRLPRRSALGSHRRSWDCPPNRALARASNPHPRSRPGKAGWVGGSRDNLAWGAAPIPRFAPPLTKARCTSSCRRRQDNCCCTTYRPVHPRYNPSARQCAGDPARQRPNPRHCRHSKFHSRRASWPAGRHQWHSMFPAWYTRRRHR
jgi:hypothetical protein